MLYRIADFLIDIEPRFPLMRRHLEEYAYHGEGEADFSVRVTDEMLEKQRAAQPEFSLPYHEGTCMLRVIADTVVHRGCFLMHAAVIAVDGVAYAFTAKSGTGKSTHLKLWMEMLGDRAFVLNGDKPLIRLFEDGTVRAYGTPWCGKEGWQRNASLPLGGLCFLERDTENHIRPLAANEAVERIFSQLLKPSTARGLAATLDMADTVLSTVPLWLLGCNISPEAAETSYTAMTGKRPRIGE